MTASNRCEARRQQSAENATIAKVAARGTPELDLTDDSNWLTAPGIKPSRAMLNKSRAPIMMVAMMALKMATTTAALSACAAQGPSSSETKVAKGAGLAS